MAFGKKVEGAAAKRPEEDLVELGFRWRGSRWAAGLGELAAGWALLGLAGWLPSPFFFIKQFLLFIFPACFKTISK
jgi:hypothetical protein